MIIYILPSISIGMYFRISCVPPATTARFPMIIVQETAEDDASTVQEVSGQMTREGSFVYM